MAEALRHEVGKKKCEGSYRIRKELIKRRKNKGQLLSKTAPPCKLLPLVVRPMTLEIVTSNILTVVLTFTVF